MKTKPPAHATTLTNAARAPPPLTPPLQVSASDAVPPPAATFGRGAKERHEACTLLAVNAVRGDADEGIEFGELLRAGTGRGTWDRLRCYADIDRTV